MRRTWAAFMRVTSSTAGMGCCLVTTRARASLEQASLGTFDDTCRHSTNILYDIAPALCAQQYPQVTPAAWIWSLASNLPLWWRPAC